MASQKKFQQDDCENECVQTCIKKSGEERMNNKETKTIGKIPFNMIDLGSKRSK